MPYFNESQLEQSIIALLQEQGYEYVKGEDIERDLDEVVLRDDLAQYLRNRYRNDGITDTEVEHLRDPSFRTCCRHTQVFRYAEQSGNRTEQKD